MFPLASSNQKILPWKNKALENFIRGREGGIISHAQRMLT